MKKITLFFICFILSISINAQTIAWSSDSEDLTGWGAFDNDGDTINWGVYSGGAESYGFNSGALFFSQSWDATIGALTPDNFLYTPVITIPGTAVSISYKMKVAAGFTPDFAEKYAVYVYDNNDLAAGDVLIHEETLTSGGDGTAKDITAVIPATFAGKNIGIVIRHYDCTNQFELLVDDFEVSYSTSLSVTENQLSNLKAFPNPTKDIIKIETNITIDKVSVINQLGQRVLEINKDGILNNKIDLSNLSKGFYLMKVTSENKSKTIKIIKE